MASRNCINCVHVKESINFFYLQVHLGKQESHIFSLSFLNMKTLWCSHPVFLSLSNLVLLVLFTSRWTQAQTSLGAYLKGVNAYQSYEIKTHKKEDKPENALPTGKIPDLNLEKFRESIKISEFAPPPLPKFSRKPMTTRLSYAICASQNIFYKPFSSMDVRNDALFVDCSFRNISFVDQVDENALSDAVAMTFSGNKIERIDQVQAWNRRENEAETNLVENNLVELDLSTNKIFYISKLAFSRLTKLRFLNLAENKLTSLNANMFYELHSIREKLFLVLKRNPWNCDCTLQSVTNTFSIYDQDHATCYSPDYLHSEPLARLISPYHKNIMTYNTQGRKSLPPRRTVGQNGQNVLIRLKKLFLTFFQ